MIARATTKPLLHEKVIRLELCQVKMCLLFHIFIKVFHYTTHAHIFIKKSTNRESS